MRALTLSLLWMVAALFGCRAAADDLEGNVSPDGKYGISVELDSVQGVVFRVFRTDGDISTLLQIRSSYQPTGEEDRAWALDNARGSNVYWRKDSAYFAISEPAVRFGGTVLAGAIHAGRASALEVPQAELEKLSGERWARVRLGVEEWTPAGDLKLILYGRAFADKIDGNDQRKIDRGYEVILKLTESFRVSSFKSGEEE